MILLDVFGANFSGKDHTSRDGFFLPTLVALLPIPPVLARPKLGSVPSRPDHKPRYVCFVQTQPQICHEMFSCIMTCQHTLRAHWSWNVQRSANLRGAYSLGEAQVYFWQRPRQMGRFKPIFGKLSAGLNYLCKMKTQKHFCGVFSVLRDSIFHLVLPFLLVVPCFFLPLLPNPQILP